MGTRGYYRSPCGRLLLVPLRAVQTTARFHRPSGIRTPVRGTLRGPDTGGLCLVRNAGHTEPMDCLKPAQVQGAALARPPLLSSSAHWTEEAMHGLLGPKPQEVQSVIASIS